MLIYNTQTEGSVVEQIRAAAEQAGVPVVDVTDAPDDTVIGDRSFGADPTTVTDYAGAYARGLRDAGVLPVLKHFPGHGDGSGDSHAGSVVTPPQYEDRQRYVVMTLMYRGTRGADWPYAGAFPGMLTDGIADAGEPAGDDGDLVGQQRVGEHGNLLMCGGFSVRRRSAPVWRRSDPSIDVRRPPSSRTPRRRR